MAELANRSDFEANFQIAKGLSDAAIEHYLTKSENVNLKQDLGNSNFVKLVENKDDADYQKLLRGGHYTHENKIYSTAGIVKLVCCYAYAHLVMQGDYLTTSHGIVVKNSQHSDSLDVGTRKQIYYQIMQDAAYYLSEVKDYLSVNDVLLDYSCFRNTRQNYDKTQVIQ